jgi:hypothetical protein
VGSEIGAQNNCKSITQSSYTLYISTWYGFHMISFLQARGDSYIVSIITKPATNKFFIFRHTVLSTNIQRTKALKIQLEIVSNTLSNSTLV